MRSKRPGDAAAVVPASSSAADIFVHAADADNAPIVRKKVVMQSQEELFRDEG